MAFFNSMFSDFPSTLKKGIFFLGTGWLVIYYFCYRLFWVQTGEPPTKLIIQLVGLGFFSCYFLVKVKKWVRPICLTGNAIIVIFFLLLAWHFFNIKMYDYLFLSILTLVFFSLSTFFLSLKPTSEYFKLKNPEPESAERSARYSATPGKPVKRQPKKKKGKR